MAEMFVEEMVFSGDTINHVKIASDFAGVDVSLYTHENNLLAFSLDEIIAAYPELICGGHIVFTSSDIEHVGKRKLYLALKHGFLK